jgi:AraC-like DNA-binding protein
MKGDEMIVGFSNFPKIIYAHSFNVNAHEFSKRLYTFLEIAFITEGSLDFVVDDFCFTGKKGDVVVIPPNSVVSCKISDGCTRYSHLSVGVKDNIELNSNQGLVVNFELLQKSNKNDQIEHLMQSLINSFTLNNQIESMGIFLLLCNKLNDNSEKQNTNQTIIYVKKIISYIENNIVDKVSIPEISKKLGITPEYASTIFKNSTGETIINYSNALKIKLAKSLLEKGGISIEFVSKSIGIDNSAYFSRMFKKHVGLSPSAYKKSVERNFVRY